ncbi:LysR family transcriptional regulator [Nocardioides sp. LS1]|nr:LysR family transcriptional regulator [Nocardioides sp. LS1]
MELRHLRYFVAVAEERHFGRAAERLHMAQPPLSTQIRQLEAELGFPLFARTTRRVELTDGGRAYLEHAHAILNAVEVAGRQSRRVAEGLEGRLTVGCVGSATYDLMPRFTRALRTAQPDVEVTIQGEMLVVDQVDALRSGDLDIALLRPPVHEPALTMRPLRSDRLVAAVPDSHPLAARPSIDVRALEREPLVVHSSRGSVMHRLVLDLCESAGFTPLVSHEVVETSTLVSFVAAGLGIAVVPEGVSKLGVPGVRYCALKGATVELCAATRTHETRPLVARALEILVEVLPEPAVETPSSERPEDTDRDGTGRLFWGGERGHIDARSASC